MVIYGNCNRQWWNQLRMTSLSTSSRTTSTSWEDWSLTNRSGMRWGWWWLPVIKSPSGQSTCGPMCGRAKDELPEQGWRSTSCSSGAIPETSGGMSRLMWKWQRQNPRSSPSKRRSRRTENGRQHTRGRRKVKGSDGSPHCFPRCTVSRDADRGWNDIAPDIKVDLVRMYHIDLRFNVVIVRRLFNKGRGSLRVGERSAWKSLRTSKLAR